MILFIDHLRMSCEMRYFLFSSELNFDLNEVNFSENTWVREQYSTVERGTGTFMHTVKSAMSQNIDILQS